MFATRALKYLLKLQECNSVSDVPKQLMDDFSPGDSDCSFFAASSCNDFCSNEVMRIVAWLLFNRPNWSSSMGLLFVPKDEIEKEIKILDEDSPGPLGTVHYNLSNMMLSEALKLLEIMLRHKNKSHQFSLGEMAFSLSSLSDEEWRQLFGSLSNERAKQKAKELTRVLFADGYHKAPAYFDEIIKGKGR